jgi:translation initiation factor IF-2
VNDLLDLIVLVADVNNITCDPAAPFKAVVIETARDPKVGISATVIIKSGTIETGTFAVSGTAFAPVRSIENFEGKRVDTLACGKPARITGFTEEPAVGSLVTVVKTKKEAEDVTNGSRVGLANTRGAAAPDDDTKTTLRLVLKADTAGSLEALRYEINKIPHPDVDVLIVAGSTGAINENDVKLLIGFTPSVILGFNTKVDASAKDLAERQHIQVEIRTIIYELSNWVTEELQKHEPDRSGDAIHGVAKVLKEFSTAGSKHVIGGKVEEGRLKRGDLVTIIRRGIEVGTGKITNLQTQRTDAAVVEAGTECGMQVDSKADIVAGDTLQVGGPGRG